MKYLLKKILNKLRKKQKLLFRHGSNFRSNAIVDSLNPQLVEIGDNFVSAPGVVITAHDASTLIHTKKYRVEKILIKDNVFLGANSVMIHTKIGELDATEGNTIPTGITFRQTGLIRKPYKYGSNNRSSSANNI